MTAKNKKARFRVKGTGQVTTPGGNTDERFFACRPLQDQKNG